VDSRPSSPGSNKGNGGEGKFIARKKGGRKRRAVAIETIRSAGNKTRRIRSGKKRSEDLNADESPILSIGSSAFIFSMRRYLATPRSRQKKEASRETTNLPFAVERKNGNRYRGIPHFALETATSIVKEYRGIESSWKSECFRKRVGKRVGAIC